MNKRVNRVYTVAEMIAKKEFNRRLEMSTTWTLAAMILAMDKAHCKVNYEKWFEYFRDIYSELIASDTPSAYVMQAGEIVDADIEIHFEG